MTGLESFILYDTEYTAWEGSMKRGWSGENEYREIVQIAALKVRVKEGEFISTESFNRFVKPTKNPQLSDYFMQLTGIKQEEVDEEGSFFKEVLEAFHFFSDSGEIGVFSWGNDIGILRENCRLNEIALPTFQNAEDLRHTFEKKGFVTKGINSGAVASHFSITLEGQEHNAMYDVYSLYHGLKALYSIK